VRDSVKGQLRLLEGDMGMRSDRTVRPRRTWPQVFGGGLLLWLLAVAITYSTGNVLLIPTVVLLGSFLVPVSFVCWAFERRNSGEITAELVFRCFLVGGVLGVLGASVLESYLLRPSPWLFVGVGLIEEAVKLAALALLTRGLLIKSTRDGIILGATVGFGFAAFESAGYALVAALTEHGLSLTDLVTTEFLRGLLAPIGHALWTGILGGVLFSRSTREHFVLTGRLLAAYVGVSLLHALWDSMPNIAVLVTFVLTGNPLQDQLLQRGFIPRPTEIQMHLFTVISLLGLAVISVVGLSWLSALVRAARRRTPSSPAWSYRVATYPRQGWPGS
jgi:RsiW-degrading membrane proteinase PrsW (M82 family)